MSKWNVETSRYVSRYIHSPVTGRLILRDRDTTADGSYDERLLAQVAADGDVVALIDHTDGGVAQRFYYDVQGNVALFDTAAGLQGWRHLWRSQWHDGGGRYLQRSGMLWDATLGSTLTYNPVLALVDKLPAPELGLWDTVVYAWQQGADVFWEDPALAGHLALDAIGLIPVIGIAADAANAVWYGFERDWTNVGLSAGAAIPGLGYGFNAVKYGSKATRLYKASRAADIGVNLGTSGYFVGHGLATDNYVEAGLGAFGIGVNAKAVRGIAQDVSRGRALQQAQVLRRARTDAHTIAEARNLRGSYQMMWERGYRAVDVNLHYGVNRGVDAVFKKRKLLFNRYATVESKGAMLPWHPTGGLGRTRLGVQGTREWTEAALRRLADATTDQHARNFARKMHRHSQSGHLDYLVTFAHKNDRMVYRLPDDFPNSLAEVF